MINIDQGDGNWWKDFVNVYKGEKKDGVKNKGSMNISRIIEEQEVIRKYIKTRKRI